MPVTNAKLLLQKARKDVPSWDTDFECDDDAIFRSSRGSAGSPTKDGIRVSSQVSDRQQHGQYRNGSSMPTIEYLNMFRETDDEDIGFSSSTTRKFNQLGLDDNTITTETINPTTTVKSTKNINTINTSTTITPTMTPRAAKQNQDILKLWSDDPSDTFGDGNFDDGTPTYKFHESNETFESPAKDSLNHLEITQGTFFTPPQESAARPATNNVFAPNTNIENSIRQPYLNSKLITKRFSKPTKQNHVEEEDLEFGFQDDDLTRIDTSNLKKFTGSSMALENSTVWDDELMSKENSSRRNSTTSLFSHPPSATTESEIDGEDFFEGLVLPESIDFTKVLKARQLAAAWAQEAESRELKSRSKGSTTEFLLYKPDLDDQQSELNGPNGKEEEQDFFRDFDLEDGNFVINNNTLHQNVKRRDTSLVDQPAINKKQLGLVPNNESTPNLASNRTIAPLMMTRAVSGATVASSSRRVSSKQPLPIPRPLTAFSKRPSINIDDIPNIPKSRKPYIQISPEEPMIRSRRSLKAGFSIPSLLNNSKEKYGYRFSKARTGKVLGDGSELDQFEDLPVDLSQESSITVAPVASSKTLGRHHHSSGISVNRVSLSMLFFFFAFQ